MADTPNRVIRVSKPLETAARSGAPELAGLEFSLLVRTALAVLAGMSIPEAIEAGRTRPGRKPRESAAA